MILISIIAFARAGECKIYKGDYTSHGNFLAIGKGCSVKDVGLAAGLFQLL